MARLVSEEKATRCPVGLRVKILFCKIAAGQAVHIQHAFQRGNVGRNIQRVGLEQLVQLVFKGGDQQVHAALDVLLGFGDVLAFTYGVMLLDGSGDINLRQLVNPGVISALIALFFGLTGWRLPDPVESALASIGSINTPMAMMIIGASLAHSDIRAAFTNPRLYRVSFLRLIVMPLVFIGLAFVIPINRMLAGLCVIVAAMPIAGNCSMLSDIYTPDDMTASHATIVSTLISGVTLPLLVLVMSMVGLG